VGEEILVVGIRGVVGIFEALTPRIITTTEVAT